MKKQAVIYLTMMVMMLSALDSSAQCAMCQRVAETGHSNDSSRARGLNKGILYLLSVPYLLGGVGVFFWYRNRKKE
jgi:hypothetical protein